MNKLIMISLLLLTIGVKAQTTDTIANMAIWDSSNVVNVFAYNGRHDVEKDRLQPELNNYIAIAKKDYCNNLLYVQYQNNRQSGIGVERFAIVCKNGDINYKTINELSPQLQESIYLFGIKLKTIIKHEN